MTQFRFNFEHAGRRFESVLNLRFDFVNLLVDEMNRIFDFIRIVVRVGRRLGRGGCLLDLLFDSKYGAARIGGGVGDQLPDCAERLRSNLNGTCTLFGSREAGCSVPKPGRKREFQFLRSMRNASPRPRNPWWECRGESCSRTSSFVLAMSDRCSVRANAARLAATVVALTSISLSNPSPKGFPH